MDDKNKIENVELLNDLNVELIPKFSHNSDVEIIRGFYKGYTGIIKGFKVDNNKIVYQIEVIELDSSPQYFNESDIRIRKKFMGIW